MRLVAFAFAFRAAREAALRPSDGHFREAAPRAAAAVVDAEGRAAEGRWDNEGRWDDQQLISPEWIELLQQSSAANSSYGYMWWLNRGGRQWDEVTDESIYYAAGFGGNFIIIDQANDMVIVTRWLEPSTLGDFMSLLRAATED